RPPFCGLGRGLATDVAPRSTGTAIMEEPRLALSTFGDSPLSSGDKSGRRDTRWLIFARRAAAPGRRRPEPATPARSRVWFVRAVACQNAELGVVARPAPQPGRGHVRIGVLRCGI